VAAFEDDEDGITGLFPGRRRCGLHRTSGGWR